MDPTLVKRFDSLSDWRHWIQSLPQHRDPIAIEQTAASILSSGIVEPLTNRRYSPQELSSRSSNHRESIKAGLLISRQRAVCLALSHIAVEEAPRLNRRTRIYATEALTDFSLFFRGAFPRFIGSEYAPSSSEQEGIFPILHQNLQALTFTDCCFDYVLSNDVLEHVPDVYSSLRECSRVLAPRGALVATFPFAHNSLQTVQKAKLENDQVVHLMEPEYHGNPMRPAEGSLVFQIPGWSVIDIALSAGFSDVFFMYVSSARHGILGSGLAGIFVFIAVK